MKLCVKKIYCPDCRKLVKGREEKRNGGIHLSCPRCKRLIWIHDGLSWRYVKQGISRPASIGQTE
jgi:hypothetical protein